MKPVAALSFLVVVVPYALAADDLTVRMRIPNGLPTDGADCTEPEKQLLLKVAAHSLMTQSSRSYYATQDGAFCHNLCLPAGRPGQFCTAVEKRCNKNLNKRRRLLQEPGSSALQITGDDVSTVKKFRILEELPDFMKEFFGFGSFGDQFDYSFSGGDSNDSTSTGLPTNPFADSSSDSDQADSFLGSDSNDHLSTGFAADPLSDSSSNSDQADVFSFQTPNSFVPLDTTANGDPSFVTFDTSVGGDLLLQQQCSDLRDLIIQAVTLGTIGDLSPKCELLVEQKFVYECFTTESLE